MLVLIVEDEPVARMLHVSMLARMQHVTAVGVDSVAAAQAFLDASAPDVIILDVQLPDGTALDVLMALAARRAAVHLVIVTGHVDELPGALPLSRRMPVLRKPASMRELQQLVEHFRQAGAPCAPFAPLEYVQLACMSQQSAVIECVAADGRPLGSIALAKGALESAHDASGSGVAALHRLSALERCEVRVLPPSGPGPQV